MFSIILASLDEAGWDKLLTALATVASHRHPWETSPFQSR